MVSYIPFVSTPVFLTLLLRTFAFTHSSMCIPSAGDANVNGCPGINVIVPLSRIFALEGNTGKFLYRIDFDETDFGKTANYKARYVNTRGEKGPWSNVITALV